MTDLIGLLITISVLGPAILLGLALNHYIYNKRLREQQARRRRLYGRNRNRLTLQNYEVKKVGQ